MFYDAQVAGLPDAGPHVRTMKRRSRARAGRAAAPRSSTAVRGEADLRFVNGGGTGSLHRIGDDPAVTELAAGSGLYGPTLFDGYDDFTPRPAMAFALPVVRRPGAGHVTAFGGGYVASAASRAGRGCRRRCGRGLSLVRTEGAGEVQTPLHGDGRRRPADRRPGVDARHAKAGELLERFDAVHLVGRGRAGRARCRRTAVREGTSGE